MMYYQNIAFLYGKNAHLNLRRTKEIGEWLRINVGVEGNARHEDEEFDWAWSLTSYLVSRDQSETNRDWRGIYFKRSEDILRFRLSFNLWQET